MTEPQVSLEPGRTAVHSSLPGFYHCHSDSQTPAPIHRLFLSSPKTIQSALIWYIPFWKLRLSQVGNAQFTVFWKIHRFSEHGEKGRDWLESEEQDSSVSLTTSYCVSPGKLLHVSRAHFPVVSEAPSSSKSPLRQIHASVSWVLKQHCFQKMILEMKHSTEKPQVTRLGDTVYCILSPSDET